MQTLKTTTMFCGEMDCQRSIVTPIGGKEFNFFYPNIMCVQMHGTPRVYKVQVTEDPERDLNIKEGYWGWWDNKDQKFVFVYPHQILLNICFAYGPEIEEKRSEGFRLPVKIEVLKTYEQTTYIRMLAI